MASAVDICNIALSHLGDTATVASLDPPEGSAQAEHCARFYPVARDALLELHNWSFATKRVSPALISSSLTEWNYAYQLPADVINVMCVLPPDVTDDYSVSMREPDYYGYSPEILPAAGYYVTQPYQVETIGGVSVLLTDQVNAVLRYTYHVTDTTKFSPLFVITLSHYLASLLAGPIIKGDAGKAEAKAQLGLMKVMLAEATQSDAVQRNIKPQQVVPWMAGR